MAQAIQSPQHAHKGDFSTNASQVALAELGMMWRRYPKTIRPNAIHVVASTVKSDVDNVGDVKFAHN